MTEKFQPDRKVEKDTQELPVGKNLSKGTQVGICQCPERPLLESSEVGKAERLGRARLWNTLAAQCWVKHFGETP